MKRDKLSAQVKVRLTPKDKELLEEYCARREITVSNFVRTLIIYRIYNEGEN